MGFPCLHILEIPKIKPLLSMNAKRLLLFVAFLVLEL